MQSSTDVALDELQVIVVLQCKRFNIIRLAHDKLGLLGYKKVIKIIMRNFVWPKLALDDKKYCESCILCLKGNKSGQRKAPMVEHPVISQPFEQVALDIVDSLPKGKGGAQFILTAVCIATRWPKAVALNSITAKSVAETAIEVFSRMCLPLQILTDRGA